MTIAEGKTIKGWKRNINDTVEARAIRNLLSDFENMKCNNVYAERIEDYLKATYVFDTMTVVVNAYYDNKKLSSVELGSIIYNSKEKISYQPDMNLLEAGIVFEKKAADIVIEKTDQKVTEQPKEAVSKVEVAQTTTEPKPRAKTVPIEPKPGITEQIQAIVDKHLTRNKPKHETDSEFKSRQMSFAF